MRQHKIIYLILAAITLAGCSEDPLEAGFQKDPSRVSFEVTMAEGYPQSQIKTRGTPQVGTTAYENKKITVLAFDQTSAEDAKKDFKAVLSKSSGIWSSDPQKAYDGLNYNFYSFASDMEDINTTPNKNGLSISSLTAENPAPSITYTVPTDTVINHPDLLIGDMVKDQSSGQVSLSMYHALSCVGFVATSKHIGNIRKIKSVTVKNVYGKGITSLDKKSGEAIKWTTLGNPDVRFTAGMKGNQLLDDKLDDIANSLTYLMNGNGYLMMVPQDLPEGAQVVMEIWDGVNDSSIHTIHYDIPPTTWEPGKKYMYYFDEPVLEGVAAYYERYIDGKLGLYYFDGATEKSNLENNMPIADAGYGLLVPASTYTQYPSIYLGLATTGNDSKDKSTSDGSLAATLSVLGGVDCVLYPLSQHLYPYSRTATTRRGFQPSYTATPIQMEAGVSETGTGKPINTHGYFLPHYAKGVYQTAAIPSTYLIRTPIQMRNISYQTDNVNGGFTVNKTYKQEFAVLDFSIQKDRTVYGKDVDAATFYKESIVINGFGGTFTGLSGKATIAGLIINIPASHNYNTALFDNVMPTGVIQNVETAASCIYICASTKIEQYVAGIVATNAGLVDNSVNRASITNNSNADVRVGGVVGLNTFRVINCHNYGVINNLSNNVSSVTGGIVAYNQKWYPSWAELSAADKKIFSDLQFGDYNKGMEANYPGALISECTNNARVTGASCAGGIAAVNDFGGVVYDCSNDAEIRNNGKLTIEIILGGIVGLQQCGMDNTSTTNPYKNDPPKFISTIQKCINTGNVTATSGVLGGRNLAVGGIVGYNDFAKGTNGRENPDDGYGIEAYGRVSQCVVRDARIAGYYSDTGGIAGNNSGSVNRSLCVDVYVSGVFGKGGLYQRNSAGGIVGVNNDYVGNCLFTHTSVSSPISNAPVWDNSSSAGGIVGINNAPSLVFKSNSGYIQKCVFAAIAPVNVPTEGEIGTFAPIAGWTGGYLFRNWKDETHMKENGVDGTTGATPIYTIDDNYYASGTGVNYTNGNTYFPNEPTTDIIIGPFTSGRYPYGQTSLSAGDQDVLPLDDWYTPNWNSGSRPPIVPSWYNYTYSLPSSGGATSILGGIVKAIKARNDSGVSGSATFLAPPFGVANTVRISLNYMKPSELNYVTSIDCDFSSVSFLSNNAGGKGFLFLRAPAGWKFDTSQTDPKPYVMTIKKKDGTDYTYYYCMVTESSGKIIKMVQF